MSRGPLPRGTLKQHLCLWEAKQGGAPMGDLERRGQGHKKTGSEQVLGSPWEGERAAANAIKRSRTVRKVCMELSDL